MNDPNSQYRVSKQPPTVFTIAVMLSMLFMLIAVIAMFIELGRWEPDYYKVNSARPNVMIRPVTHYEIG